MIFEAGKTYRYKKADDTYLCLFVGETYAFLRRLSDGLEFLERGFSEFSEVKPKRIYERWVNCHPTHESTYHTRQQAEKHAGNTRIALLHIRREYEEGEGL